MRLLRGILFVLCGLAFLPASAFAQATITGVVKDASGAVLPGVTVEAASPVLIEKVRSAVSDGAGQYRIVDLLAGTYTVTFTLPGFSTVKREGIELTGSFIATVNADMKVGGVERDDHRHRRDADCRRAKRSTADDAQQRGADDGADGARVGGHRVADSGHRHSGGRQRGHSGHAADDCVRRGRRARERRAHAGRRIEHRRRAQRRRRVHLHRRHLERGGSVVHDVGRSG